MLFATWALVTCLKVWVKPSFEKSAALLAMAIGNAHGKNFGFPPRGVQRSHHYGKEKRLRQRQDQVASANKVGSSQGDHCNVDLDVAIEHALVEAPSMAYMDTWPTTQPQTQLHTDTQVDTQPVPHTDSCTWLLSQAKPQPAAQTDSQNAWLNDSPPELDYAATVRMNNSMDLLLASTSDDMELVMLESQHSPQSHTANLEPFATTLHESPLRLHAPLQPCLRASPIIVSDTDLDDESESLDDDDYDDEATRMHDGLRKIVADSARKSLVGQRPPLRRSYAFLK